MVFGGFRRYQFVGALVLALGLGVFLLVRWLVFANAFPLVETGANLDKYRVISENNGLVGLLRTEKVFGDRFAKEAVVGNLEETIKVFDGDKVFIYNDHDLYKDAAKRPIKYASFSKMKVSGQLLVIVGERVLNKNGTVSYLHFGFSDPGLSDYADGFRERLEKQVSFQDHYMIPAAFVEDCNVHRPSIRICEQMDKKWILTLVEEWVKTGNVPAELEQTLLVPYLFMW